MNRKAKILLTITRGERGGAQMHVLELVGGLRERFGFRVVVGDDEFLAGALRMLGVDVVVLPELRRAVSPVADARALSALRREVRAFRPALVHTHSSKAGILGRLAARAEGVPSVHTAHAWSFSDGLSPARRAGSIPVEWLVGRMTARFITVSEADAEVGTRWGVARPEQVRVVHNGIGDVPERAAPDAAGVPVLTMVARLAPPKDPTALLQALAGIDTPWRLRFVGDGPDRAAVEAAVDTLGLRSRVELLGVRADIPQLLASSHVGLLVSRQEGFPLVLLEAMRAGLPVVASDVGGIREAVTDGVTGHLVPRGDVDTLRLKLAALVSDPEARRRLGDAGRRAYEARFTLEAMLRGTAAVYDEVAR